MIKKLFVLNIGLLLVVVITSRAQGWRGIIPLRSTCEDVKRILKVDSCELPKSKYKLSGFEVTVEFSNSPCNEGWSVSPGTVLSLIVSPIGKMALGKFNLEKGRFKRIADEEIVGRERYENPADGVTVYAFNGLITEILFYPSRKDQKLRCSSP